MIPGTIHPRPVPGYSCQLQRICTTNQTKNMFLNYIMHRCLVIWGSALGDRYMGRQSIQVCTKHQATLIWRSMLTTMIVRILINFADYSQSCLGRNVRSLEALLELIKGGYRWYRYNTNTNTGDTDTTQIQIQGIQIQHKYKYRWYRVNISNCAQDAATRTLSLEPVLCHQRLLELPGEHCQLSLSSSCKKGYKIIKDKQL